MTDTETPIWYVAFGSNLLRARLLAYIEGGMVPGSPADVGHSGARDASPPAADERQPLDYRLYFANNSKRWGGGVAFLDPQTRTNGDRETIGRRYLLTVGQLEDVWRQENGADQVVEVEIERLRTDGQLAGHSGWYRTLLFCGDHTDGIPMATITSSVRHPANPPSSAYTSVIRSGLAELGLTEAECNAYLKLE